MTAEVRIIANSDDGKPSIINHAYPLDTHSYLCLGNGSFSHL